MCHGAWRVLILWPICESSPLPLSLQAQAYVHTHRRSQGALPQLDAGLAQE